MNLYFRIVRLAKRRFSWKLVDEQGRLVARSDYYWRSRKKVRKAINQLKDMIEDAEVVDPTKSRYPEISFTLTPYALPLLVDEPAEYLTAASAAGRRQDEPSEEGATYRPFPIASHGTASGNARASKHAQAASTATDSSSASTQQGSRRRSAAKKSTQKGTAKKRASSGAMQTATKRTSRTRKTTTASKNDSGSPSAGKRKRGRTGR